MELKWKNNIIPTDLEEKLLSKITTRGNYGKVTSLKDVADEYNIDERILISLRSAFLKEKTIFRSSHVKRKVKKIIRDFNNNILKLAHKYDYPPVGLIRFILSGQGVSKDNIRRLLKNPTDHRLIKKGQILIALDNDIVSNPNQDDQKKNADLFEEKLYDYFRNKNIKFKTENELKEEQIKEFGYPISTPDLLITQELNINGKPVKWIDAKNYYGSNLPITKKRLKEQSQKYFERYGPGAFIFNYGISSELRIDNAQILNI